MSMRGGEGVCMMAASFVFVTSLFSQRNLVGDRAVTPCDPDATAAFQVDQVIFLLVDALTPTVAVGPARARDTPHKATFTALRERLMWEAPDQIDSGSPFADVAGFVSVADSPTTTSQPRPRSQPRPNPGRGTTDDATVHR